MLGRTFLKTVLVYIEMQSSENNQESSWSEFYCSFSLHSDYNLSKHIINFLRMRSRVTVVCLSVCLFVCPLPL